VYTATFGVWSTHNWKPTRCWRSRQIETSNGHFSMTRYSTAISQTAAKFSGISRFFHLSSCPVYNEPHQLSDYGQRQTMNHVVDIWPLTKFEGGLNLLHEADDDTVIWLESTVTAALTHTHTRLTALSGTTQASQYQKGKTNVDFTEARDSEWQ